VVYDQQNNNMQVSYAELAAGRQIVHKLKEKPDLKKPSEFKIIGKPVSRRDSVLKVTGRARYAGDIRLEGLLYAKILRPPSHRAELIEVDFAEAEKLDGVEIVRDGDFIAVLHEDYERASLALRQIKAKYREQPPEVDDGSIFDYLVEKGTVTREVETHGDVAMGAGASKEIEESTFLDGYVAHAPIETHTATAVMEGDKINIWASTQTPFGARGQVSKALEMPPEKVHLHEVFIGGGFGGKIAGPQVVEAARIARLSGKPVQLIWTRREEFFYDTYRPAAVVRIKSGIDELGLMKLWDYQVYFAGARGSTLFYNFPDSSVTYHHSGRERTHPFNTGAWRAPGNNTNTFARESQMDIMAVKAGIDPLDFRLKNLKDEKMIRVLEAAADTFGWTKAPEMPSGRGYGIACGIDAGTYVAVMAEVKVDTNTGQVEVVRVAVAQDMGLMINPLGTRMQIESCVIMGLGYSLSEDIQFEGGKILNRNFDKYELPRFSWIPEIESVIIDAQDDPPQGGGEPAIICMGGAVANAIFDASGARLFQLPMTPDRILAALD
jgi:isoquinoline 1-oxidoreductase